MNKITLAGVTALAVALGAYLYPRPDTPNEGSPAAALLAEGAGIVEVSLPATLSDAAERGKRAYDAVCAACHGQNAAGRMGLAPPLVHRIYEPSHHGDIAFQMAAARGVRAHHWPFGDMPAQPDVTPADVEAIIAYVRTLQRANGIH